MKRQITFIFLLLHLVIGSALGSSDLEASLRILQSREVTYENLGNVYKQRTAAPNAQILADVLRACAAGLLYVGKEDVYSKQIRPHIPNVQEFEKSLQTPCTKCSAVGRVRQNCNACGGNGRCKAYNCQGGQAEFRGLNNRVDYRPCAVCKGTGSCLDCKGDGTLMRACASCFGRGGTFASTQALASCRDHAERALSVYDELNAVAQRREQEQHVLAIELGTKREAILLEAKTVAEERARQEGLMERERLARKLQEEEDARFASQDQTYLRKIVVIEGDRSNGTGFLCTFDRRKVVLSNAHVLCGNRTLSLKTIGRGEIEVGRIWVCKDRDVVAFEVLNPDRFEFLDIYDDVSGMNNQERIVVFGNSGGGGVITTLRGRMQGLGPSSIEVDATFVGGNSGSPIIAYDYNSVVAMATYATRNPQVNWTDRSTRFADVRRFGVRIDDMSWNDFFPLDQAEYEAALDQHASMIEFAAVAISRLRWAGDQLSATPAARGKARQHLAQYRKTPQWMLQYSDEAALAAKVCALMVE